MAAGFSDLKSKGDTGVKKRKEKRVNIKRGNEMEQKKGSKIKNTVVA